MERPEQSADASTVAPPAGDHRAAEPARPEGDRPDPPVVRFRPTGQVDLAQPGEVTRLRANLAALETLRAIQAAGRPATGEEQAVLARWSGWGAVAGVFEYREDHPNFTRFAAERERLRQLLSEDEYRAAEANTLNAHYTDAEYVRAIWDALGDLGFTGGRVLEPGCGSGNFIGLAPETARLVGVEVEPVTAAIAGLLYPDSQILAESFADTRAPTGAFDAVVGNVPFADLALHDKRHNPGKHSIHNHFTIKSLHLTRPRGLVAVLTSRYTLDALNPAARREMSALGDLVAALRLPTAAHRAAAGTDVVTDLLILRRRPPEATPAGAAWEQVRDVDLPGGTTQLNEYFAEHPERILGQARLGQGMYHDHDLLVDADGPIGARLRNALAEVVGEARGLGLTMTPAPAVDEAPITPVAVLANRDNGHLALAADGTFTQIVGGQVRPYPVPKTQVAELTALLEIRDTVTTLLSTEAATVDDTEDLAVLRTLLNERYDAYVSIHGPINRYTPSEQRRRNPDTGLMEPVVDPTTGEVKVRKVRPPMGGFRDDPYAPTVFALEDFDPATRTAKKADIFTSRVIAPRVPRLGADTAEDALAICLDSCGEVRLSEIARLLGMDPTAARSALGELVFDEPGTDRLVEAPAYLSGNVRDKLRQAETAATTDARFEPNVRALRWVIPRDLGPGEIDAALGACWIGAPDVQLFLQEILHDPTVKVRHLGGADWTVSGVRHGVSATSTWGTPYKSAIDLAQAALRQKPIKVYEQLGGDTRVFSPEATATAQAKLDELNERFAVWVWEDPERTERLVRTYNDTLNAHVIRSYEGVTRSLPGLSVTLTPYPHQVETVARIVNEPAVGIFHVVGAGKTLVMAMGVMESKRLGLVTKPAIVVPNHMLEQFTTEFLWAYPQARLLAAGRDDMSADRRRRFVSRAATGTWDCIIMTAGFFESLNLSVAERKKFMDAELEAMRAKLADLTKQVAADGEQPQSSPAVKQLQKELQRRTERVKEQLDKVKDPGLTFEQTGIDYVMRDELHELKNDTVMSNISDAAKAGSDRAIDFRMKTDYLRRSRNTLRVCSGATATPIANSVSEMWVVTRQLRPDLLANAGLMDFDTWAATFGKVVSVVEVSPTGTTFRMKSRFAEFRNVPELMQIFRLFGDVRTAEDLRLPTPALVANDDGQRLPQIVPIAASPELENFIRDLDDRVDDIRSGHVNPRDDNMLKISSEARAASLDLRLIGMPQSTPGKLATAAATIAGIYHRYRDTPYPNRDGTPHPIPGALQLVFCDLGTPVDRRKYPNRWTAYDELRDLLVEQGLPRRMVRFIHEANSDREKGELFQAARSGEIAVLIGSTQRMGVGTNVQDRAVALHHLDCPWRPADVAQREGRILRQHNQNPEVRVFRYVVTGSFDGYSWQTVGRKARFIDQAMRSRNDVRSIEDIGEEVFSYDLVKAVATNNPLLFERTEAEAAYLKLQRAETAHHFAQTALARSIADNREWITRDAATLRTIDAAIAARQDTRGDRFAMTVGGRQYDARADAGQALQHQLLNAIRRDDASTLMATSLGGFEIETTVWFSDHNTMVTLVMPAIPQAATSMTETELADANPVGLVRRLEHLPTTLENLRTTTTANTERCQQEIARATEQIGQPFAKADQLAAARDRLADVDARIAAAAQPEKPSHSPSARPAPAAAPRNATPLRMVDLATWRPASLADEPFRLADRAWTITQTRQVANHPKVQDAAHQGDLAQFGAVFDRRFKRAILAGLDDDSPGHAVAQRFADDPGFATLLMDQARTAVYQAIRGAPMSLEELTAAMDKDERAWLRHCYHKIANWADLQAAVTADDAAAFTAAFSPAFVTALGTVDLVVEDAALAARLNQVAASMTAKVEDPAFLAGLCAQAWTTATTTTQRPTVPPPAPEPAAPAEPAAPVQPPAADSPRPTITLTDWQPGPLAHPPFESADRLWTRVQTTRVANRPEVHEAARGDLDAFATVFDPLLVEAIRTGPIGQRRYGEPVVGRFTADPDFCRQLTAAARLAVYHAIRQAQPSAVEATSPPITAAAVAARAFPAHDRTTGAAPTASSPSTPTSIAATRPSSSPQPDRDEGR